MSTHSATEFLARVEPLSVPQRNRQAALLGRKLRDSPADVATVVRDLESSGNEYEQRLAALIACAAGDTQWVAAHIADINPSIQRTALRTAVARPELVPDSAFEDALHDASTVQRISIYKSLGGRTELADRLIPSVRKDWGDASATLVLASCSPAVVATLLPKLLHAVMQWRPFARRYPTILLDALGKDLSAAPAPVKLWWKKYGDALGLLLQFAPRVANVPKGIFDLLEKYPAPVPKPLVSRVHILACSDPNRFLRLLTSNHPYGLDTHSGKILKVLARPGGPEFEAFVRKKGRQAWQLTWILRALPPRGRRAIFEMAMGDRGILGGGRGLETPILDALPTAFATQLARAALVTMIAEKEPINDILEAKSYLPPSEVKEELLVATRRPQASDRGIAWRYYVQNVARTRDSVQINEAVEVMVTHLKNEQSPVRSTGLSALLRIPAHLWSEAALPHLAQLARNTLDARDTADSELTCLTRLTIKLLTAHWSSEAHRSFAFDTLRQINKHCQWSFNTPLDTLRRGQEQELYDALRPLIEDAKARNSFDLLFSLAEGLQRRAGNIPELQAELRQVIECADVYSASTAVTLWLEPKSTRSTRVAELVALEPSAVTIPPVQSLLSTSRSDLLDKALVHPPPYGRYLDEGTQWTFKPSHKRHVRLWTQSQQTAYLAQLQQAAKDNTLDTKDRARAIKRMAAVPGSMDTVRDWAGSDEVSLAEAGIVALAAWTENIPVLLSRYMDGDHARVAMYAATSASRRMRPSEVLDSMLIVLNNEKGKVTAKKEAVRLTAMRLAASRAVAPLASIFASPNTHRDVRAACVAFASLYHLGTDEGWNILEEAASPAADPTVRRAVLRFDQLGLSPPLRERYAKLVCILAEADDDEVATDALQKLRHWAGFTKSAPGILATVFTDMDRSRTVWHTAGTSLVMVSNVKLGAAALCSALQDLIACGPEPDAGEVHDRPAYRRIKHVVVTLRMEAQAKEYRSAARVAAGVLAGYPDFVPHAAELLVVGVDFTAPVQDTTALLEDVARMCANRPVLAARLSNLLRFRGPANWPEHAPGALTIARGLLEEETLAEGLFATVIVNNFGGALAWPDEWKEVLRALRRHEVPDVRDAAVEVETWGRAGGSGESHVVEDSEEDW